MHRWKFSALAAAAFVSVSLTTTDAWALALGRLQVQSALGEPLRAEVDLPQITASEADSLNASIATPAVYQAQGMEYSATASQLTVQLQRRPDGSAVLQLRSAQPVNDPFVDLVIDASWNAGHVVRSYTLLLDPAALRKAAPTVTAPPQVTESAAPTPPPAQTPAPLPAAQPTPAAAASSPAVRAPVPPPQNAQPSLTVRRGDTASQLANAHRPAGVSLDQMLVAMLRANPHAFISGNVNRMKAGAVVEMPDQAAALATPRSEARQIVAAQSRDFNAYRRRLAAAAPMATVAAAHRSASGNVEAQVDDKKPSTAAPDKLTLSKGALQASQADERLAQEKQAQSQSERLAELSRNLNELEQVAGAAGAAGMAAPPSSGGIALPLEDSPLTAAAPADENAPPPLLPAAPAVEAAPATAAAPAPAPAPAPQSPPSFADTLREQPALPLAGAGLLALLLGYAGYRVVKRRRQQTASGEGPLPAASFFGADGGLPVDTAASELGNGPSMDFTDSQLDTDGEVDPVAEAEVYLAYGRDLQAEEILKEALHHQPERIAVHQKLADIYAKRQDRKAFEVVAQAVFALTQGQGAEWLHLAEQGRALEPENPLYQAAAAQPMDQPGADSTDSAPDTAPTAAMALAAGGFAAALADAAQPPAAPQPDEPEPAHEDAPSFTPTALKFDLDLDLGLDSERAEPPAPAAPQPPEEQAPEASSHSIDFEPQEPTWKLPASAGAPASADTAPADSELPSLPDSAPEAPAEDLPAAAPVDQGLEWSGSEAPATATVPEPEPAPDAPAAPLTLQPEVDAPTSAAPAAPTFDFPEFDLSGLTLDLGDTASATSLSQSSQAAAEDPLATKLALAQEFSAIGDSEGARTLIEEVVEEAEGELKERAKRLLAEIE